MPDSNQPPRLDVLVQRQLDVISTGNGAYLETFLRVVRRAGFDTRVVFAPRHSFGNRPWASIHPRLNDLMTEIVWPGTAKIGSRYWSYSPIVWGRFAIRLIKEGLRRLGLNPKVGSYLGKPLNASETRVVTDIVNSDPCDITIAEYSSMGPVLGKINAPTRKGILMHDVLSDRGVRARAQGIQPTGYEVTPEEEVSWCSDSDLMIYASANEMANFQPKVPSNAAVWLRPEPPVYQETPREGPPRLVFIGTTHAGNTDTLRHFLSDIWPLIRKRVPDIELWIVGSVGSTLDRDELAEPGIKSLGRVDHLESVGGPYSIGIAPTRLATGISIKVAEYLMLDMACIAYPRALEGFKTALDDVVKIADSPEAFAEAAVTLILDRGARENLALSSRAKAQSALDNAEVEAFLRLALKGSNQGVK